MNIKHALLLCNAVAIFLLLYLGGRLSTADQENASLRGVIASIDLMRPEAGVLHTGSECQLHLIGPLLINAKEVFSLSIEGDLILAKGATMPEAILALRAAIIKHCWGDRPYRRTDYQEITLGGRRGGDQWLASINPDGNVTYIGAPLPPDTVELMNETGQLLKAEPEGVK